MTLENLPFPDVPKGANKRSAVPAAKGAYTYRRGGETAILGLLAMRYIERILQPGETVLYSGRIHWVIYLPAIILMLLAVAALTQFNSGPAGTSWLIGSGALWLAAAVAFVPSWFRRWTTEIDVTNMRVVFKRGFIKRHTVEMNMDKVESVDVDQSIFGRLLNYGDVTIHGTGEGWETLKGIDAPLDLRNHVTAR
jgi:membrane protein YdbS with pleckstrin-like domain